MKISRLLFLSTALSTAFLVACGDSSTSSTTTGDQTGTTEMSQSDVPASVSLTIEGNDQMRYSLDRLEAFEGQNVTLTLSHVGKLEKQAMGHNWVLLKPSTDMTNFANAAIAATDNDYLPADMADGIIAHTSMIGGGESTKVEFVAPAPGVYNFLCTFPGHSALMKGVFVSKAR